MNVVSRNIESLRRISGPLVQKLLPLAPRTGKFSTAIDEFVITRFDELNRVEYYYTETEGVELILTKGQAHCYPWHMHTRHWIVGVIRRGTVCLMRKTVSQRLCQGQFFCIYPYEPHSLGVDPGSSLVVTCFDEQGASLLDRFPEALFSHISGLHTDEKNKIVEAIASSKLPVFSDNHREGRLAGLHSLCGCSIREIMRRVMEKPEESLSVDQMAAYAGYSQWHFLRAFQKATGMTPHAFQLLCRVCFLRSLLRADTEASTAAVSAGFADQSHMHKVFKHHHGMTPGEFVKANVRLEL